MARHVIGLLLCWSVTALANPLAPWSAELERAQARGPEAVVAHARQAPALARIWGHGHLVDAVAGPDRAAWTARIAAVAEAIDDADLRAALADPGLAGLVEAAPAATQAWESQLRAGSPEPALLAAGEQGDLAEFVFYFSLFRASMGPAPDADLLGVARHLAQGRALILGRLDWFGDLQAFHGGPVPSGGHGEVEEALTRLLNARLAGDGRAVRQQGEIALRGAERRGKSLVAALVANLAATVAGWEGRPGEEAARRIQVLQAIRPLGHPQLTGALLAGLVAPHLATDRPEAALTFLDELAALGPEVLTDRRHRQSVAEAAAALGARVDDLLQQGELVGASRAAEAALRAEILARGADPGRPLERLVAARLRQARLALDRGLAGEVHAELSALEAPTPAERRLEVEALVLLGRAGDARRILDGLAADAPIAAASLDAERGRLALAEGRAAPAFAFANQGLRRIARREDAAAERRALHVVAAAALHAVGQVDAARARLEFAARIGEPDFDFARTYRPRPPRGRGSGGGAAGPGPWSARAAGRAAPRRAARVGEGCVLAGAGRAPEALEALAAGEGAQGPWRSRPASVGSRRC
ncbi:MAG: hypothetical protein R3F43_01915 [bacterium]